MDGRSARSARSFAYCIIVFLYELIADRDCDCDGDSDGDSGDV